MPGTLRAQFSDIKGENNNYPEIRFKNIKVYAFPPG